MATMEVLDHLGVRRDDLKNFRKASPWTKNEIEKHLKGGIDDVIDCSSTPHGSYGRDWSVKYHDEQVPFHWNNGKNVRLVRFPSWLRAPGTMSFNVEEVRSLIEAYWKDEICLNANVLDHLLSKKYLVPWDWKGRKILFPGTLYNASYGQTYYAGVRGLRDNTATSADRCVWVGCQYFVNAFHQADTFIALRVK